MATEVAPRGCTNLKLRQAARLVTRHYDACIAGTGLRITQYSLLSHVVSLGPLPAGALADAMKLDASTLSRNLAPLVHKGLLQLSPGADARQRLVQATEAGHAARAEAQREWKRAQVTLNQRLGPARVAALHALLDECIAALEPSESDSVR